ncbi:15877_t:CDS:2, partial [Funneliformis mosseae]
SVNPEIIEIYFKHFGLNNINTASSDKAIGDYFIIHLKSFLMKNLLDELSNIIITQSLKESHEYVLHFSVVLYFYAYSFYKRTANFSKDIEFLKADKFAKQLQANKSNKLNKRLEINGHENAKSKELKVINDSIKRLKNSNIEQLEAQLEYFSKKVTDSANATKPAGMKDITIQEVLMMKSLYWLVKELAKETETIKQDLKKGEKFGNLSSEEKADLASISNYLETDLLRADDLENIFEIDVDISESKVEE